MRFAFMCLLRQAKVPVADFPTSNRFIAEHELSSIFEDIDEDTRSSGKRACGTTLQDNFLSAFTYVHGL